jgi:hypothetical protein
MGRSLTKVLSIQPPKELLFLLEETAKPLTPRSASARDLKGKRKMVPVSEMIWQR